MYCEVTEQDKAIKNTLKAETGGTIFSQTSARRYRSVDKKTITKYVIDKKVQA